MHQDARGLGLTTASAAAAAHFDQAVADYIDYRLSASRALKLALEEDPGFLLAHCFRAYLLQLLETGAILPKVSQALARMRPGLDAATRRERLHVHALEAWAAGDILGACQRWEEILCEHPLDILALKLHHYLTFWTGRNYALRAAVAGVLPAWDESIPGFASVQGMYAFALEECGEYAAAERWGREAVERNAEDLWAIHSVAHVLEMQGRSREGADWLDYPGQRFADRNPFQGHIWWHAALFNLAQGDHGKVLSLYDEQMCAVNSDMYVDVQNQASLLKRLELRGVEVGDRWRALAEHAEGRVDDHILAFNDVHFFLSLAADGRTASARRQLDSMTAFAGANRGWTAETVARITAPLCEALLAYESGDNARTCDLLWPLRNDLSPLGGSHAQRDLFLQILADAALRAGRFAMARSLFSERLSSRPTSRANWAGYAEALAGLGEEAQAAAARRDAQAAAEPDASA